MACDLQLCHASGMKFKIKSKIIEVPTYTAENVFGCKKAFIGFAGNADQMTNVWDWINSPNDYKKPPRIKEIELLLLNDKGQIFHGTNLNNWLAADTEYMSIGTGMHFAMSAMSLGKTPKEAVKVAMKLDPNTGFGVKEYKI